MKQILLECLASVLGIVLTAAATWICSRVAAWLNTKITDKKTQTLTYEAIDIIQDAVKSTYQTYVEALKGTDAWTADAQKTALEKATTTAISQFTPEITKFVTTNYTDITTWVQNKIESTLYDLKN